MAKKNITLAAASDDMLNAAMQDLEGLGQPASQDAKPEPATETPVQKKQEKPKVASKAKQKEEPASMPEEEPAAVEEPSSNEEDADTAAECLIALPPKKKCTDKAAILIRVPVDEKEVIEKLAAERGMSVSAFCAAVLHAVVKQAGK